MVEVEFGLTATYQDFVKFGDSGIEIAGFNTKPTRRDSSWIVVPFQLDSS